MKRDIPWQFPKREIRFAPFMKEAKRYSYRTFRDDLFSALSIALLAIPQSMAYALLAGLPPLSGLFSAIFGVILTSLMGSSRHLVSGPSTGVAILLQSTIADTLTLYPNYAPEQLLPITLHILAQILLIIGILQIALGFFRLGKLLQFVSRSVILGYFAGVILAIIVSQLYYLFGISSKNSGVIVLYKAGYLFYHLYQIQWVNALLGVLGLSLLLLGRKYYKKFPSALLVVVVIGGIAYLCNQNFAKSTFPYWQKMHITTLGDMKFLEKPSIQFSGSVFDLKLINKIFPAALAIALLSILEVFSVSKGIGAKSGQHTNANQEIFAVGIANTFLAFLHGAMPSSGSVSRSTLNYVSRGRTRFAACYSGIFVALFTFLGWPLIQHIPLVSLAVILLAIAPTLIHRSEVKLCFRATKGDSLVFLLTMGSCLIFTLDIAFFIGIVISLASYLRKAADPHLVEYAFNTGGRLCSVEQKKEVRRKIRIIGVGGELFFAVVELLQSAFRELAKDPYVEVIVLRLNGVHYIDASTCYALMRLHEYLKATKRHLVISGISEEVWQTLYKTKLVRELGADNLFLSDDTKPQLSTWRACMRAEELIHQKKVHR